MATNEIVLIQSNRAANALETMQVGLKVGVPATLFVVGSNTIMNQTGLDRGKRTAAVTLVGAGLTALVAPKYPSIAAGLFIGTVVNLGVQLAQASRLDAKVDAYFARLPAPAAQQNQAGAQQNQAGAQQQQQQLPASNQQSTAPGSGIYYGQPSMVHRSAA